MAATYGGPEGPVPALEPGAQQEQQLLPQQLEAGTQVQVDQLIPPDTQPATASESAAPEPAAAAAVPVQTAAKPMVRAVPLQQQVVAVDAGAAPTGMAGPVGLVGQLLMATAQPVPAMVPSQPDDGLSIPSYALEDSQAAGLGGSQIPAAGAGAGLVHGGGAHDRPGSGRAVYPPGFSPVEVFVGGLPPNAQDFDVFLALADAGEVLSVKLFRRNRDKGECRGYGACRARWSRAMGQPC
jgi:hypothetical protein